MKLMGVRLGCEDDDTANVGAVYLPSPNSTLSLTALMMDPAFFENRRSRALHFDLSDRTSVQDLITPLPALKKPLVDLVLQVLPLLDVYLLREYDKLVLVRPYMYSFALFYSNTRMSCLYTSSSLCDCIIRVRSLQCIIHSPTLLSPIFNLAAPLFRLLLQFDRSVKACLKHTRHTLTQNGMDTPFCHFLASPLRAISSRAIQG